MIRIGIVGEYQSGKSLLINCILRRPVATVGDQTATTHVAVHYLYSEEESVCYRDGDGFHQLEGGELNGLDTRSDVSEVSVYIRNDILKEFSLVDMPGVGFDGDDDKAVLAEMERLDCALFLVTNYKELSAASLSYQRFRVLQKLDIPYYLILNCSYSYSEKWDPLDEMNAVIAQNGYGVLSSHPPLRYPFFEEERVPIVNLMWYWLYLRGREDTLVKKYAIQLRADGLLEEDVPADAIKEASRFHFIERIFSMDNLLYLTLQKEIKEKISNLREELCPIGTIQAFAYKQIPSGWLPCDGSELLVADYQDLFVRIGHTYGGDGKTTFKVPDLRGRFIRGWDESASADTEQREFGSVQDDAIQRHTHEIPSLQTSSEGNHAHRVFFDVGRANETYLVPMFTTVFNVPKTKTEYSRLSNSAGTDSTGNHSHLVPESRTREPLANDHVRVCDETRPKNLALQYCIKARNL